MKVKNTKDSADTWVGQQIESGNYYTIQSAELSKWQNDTKVLTDLASGDLLLNDEIEDISDIGHAINILKGIDPTPRDANGSPITTINSQPPYGSKTIIVNGVTKKLYARFTGFQQTLDEGSNEIVYTATYPWAKMIGIEVIGCESLDTADLKVYDTAAGTYSGVPNLLLSQFSFSLNLPKDFYSRMAQFDADLYQGMVIKITYNSISAKDIGINLLLNEVKT